MRKEKLLLGLIAIINYVIWLIMTAGFLSLEYFLISSVSFVIYNILLFNLGSGVLALLLRTKNFSEAGDLYNVVNHACNDYQYKSGATQKQLKLYYFKYNRPIAFAFGNKSVFISSAIVQLRQSQQNQICTQAIAETYSFRGLSNLFVIVGNLLVVVAFVFLLIGKWIIYIQLQILKFMIVFALVLFDMFVDMTSNIFFGRTRQSVSSIWMMRLMSLFSSDKISDVIYLYSCAIISAFIYAISFIQIALVERFDFSTDRLLSKVWSKQELINYINSDFDEFMDSQSPFNIDRLKMLCRVVEAHCKAELRLKEVDSYYGTEPIHNIAIHRNDMHQPTRIKIRKGTDGGHHEN